MLTADTITDAQICELRDEQRREGHETVSLPEDVVMNSEKPTKALEVLACLQSWFNREATS